MNQKTKNTMTLGEFRRMFGVPARTLRYWISTGRIRVMKIPNGRGGFSKRLKRIETLADLIALHKPFIKARPARGPFPMPLPKSAKLRAGVRGFIHALQKKGEIYPKKRKSLETYWRSILEPYKYSNAEIESAITNKLIIKAKTIPL